MSLLFCRVLEPSTPVKPVISYMMDAANGSIEYDVVQSDKQTALLSLSGPMDARCPQTSSFGLLRCLGHQHIGGQCMRLINQDNGEELCSSCPSYGNSDTPETVGEESGYLVKMSQTVFDQPKQIQPGTNVTIESEYDPSENHFGVMALFFLDLVDFNTSCPGPVTATTGNAFWCIIRHRLCKLPAMNDMVTACYETSRIPGKSPLSLCACLQVMFAILRSHQFQPQYMSDIARRLLQTCLDCFISFSCLVCFN